MGPSVFSAVHVGPFTSLLELSHASCRRVSLWRVHCGGPSHVQGHPATILLLWAHVRNVCHEATVGPLGVCRRCFHPPSALQRVCSCISCLMEPHAPSPCERPRMQLNFKFGQTCECRGTGEAGLCSRHASLKHPIRSKVKATVVVPPCWNEAECLHTSGKPVSYPLCVLYGGDGLESSVQHCYVVLTLVIHQSFMQCTYRSSLPQRA
jgi:hypothetical protein